MGARRKAILHGWRRTAARAAAPWAGACARRGSIAIMFALMAPLMLIVAGAGVDMAVAVQFKRTLQSAVDSAALAGATVYTDASLSGTASTQATTYMNNLVPTLPANTGVTFSVATSAPAGSYQVKVTANAAVSTSFLAIFVKSIPVTATATAADVFVQGKVSAGNFKSNAGDRNTVYYYFVPQSGNPPVFNAADFPSGTYTDGTFTALFTNGGSNNPPSSNLTFTVPAGQQVGFALVNVTGALSNYGDNQYGGTPGSTHVFYSQLSIPNSSTNTPGGYTNASKYTNGQSCGSGGYGYGYGYGYGHGGYNPNCGTVENCSLETQQVTGSTLPTPASGSCSTTAQTNAAPSCAQLNGQTWQYSWNDMGGTTDDFDYNDAQFTFTCSGGTAGGSGTRDGVVLIN